MSTMTGFLFPVSGFLFLIRIFGGYALATLRT